MSPRKKVSLIEQVVELAMKLGGEHLADYGATTSRHDFTQRQLMTCLILRVYLGTTYRGVLDRLAASSELRERMGLGEKLPHFTTLQKFSSRSKVVEIAQVMLSKIAAIAALQRPQDNAVAMDATGLSRTTVSDYFSSRKGRRLRRWVKVSVMIVCGSLLPLALEIDLRPGHDCLHARSLLKQAQAVARPQRLYADAGYDAEWIHEQCRSQWGVESVIQPVQRRVDGQRGGHWRAKMSSEYLSKAHYGRRWAVESFFSALKRTMGSALRSRRPDQMLAEAALKVLAYTLKR